MIIAVFMLVVAVQPVMAYITEEKTVCGLFDCSTTFSIDKDLTAVLGSQFPVRDNQYPLGQFLEHKGKIRDINIEILDKSHIKVSGKIEGASSNLWGFTILGDESHLNSTWWNSSFSYKAEINISNLAGDLYNYEVNITLDENTLGNFSWERNGADVRFYNGSEVELYHFNDPYTWNATTKTASFWINVTYLKNNTNNTIFIYYGNATAVTTSDPDHVFQEWINETDAGDFACDNHFYAADDSGELKVYNDDTGADKFCRLTVNHTAPFIAEWYLKSNDVATDGTVYGHGATDDTKAYLNLRGPKHGRENDLANFDGSSVTDIYTSWKHATYYKVVSVATDTTDFYLYTPNYTAIASLADEAQVGSPSGNVNQIFIGDGATNTYRMSLSIRYIMVRQYASIEPVIYIGSEESNLPASYFNGSFVNPTLTNGTVLGFDNTSFIINISISNNTEVSYIVLEFDGTNITGTIQGNYAEFTPDLTAGTVATYRGYINSSSASNATETRYLVISTFTESERDDQFSLDELTPYLLLVLVGIIVFTLIKRR